MTQGHGQDDPNRRILRKGRLGEEAGRGLQDRSPAELIRMVWPMTKAAWAFAEAARSKDDASGDGAPEGAPGTEAAPSGASSGPRPSHQEPRDPDAPHAERRLQRHLVRLRRGQG
jgi:hypothetical protein